VDCCACADFPRNFLGGGNFRDTLFDFAANRTHKILLADLDLPATHKANDDRGVDFQIPAGTSR